jgi:hypothetical protein
MTTGDLVYFGKPMQRGDGKELAKGGRNFTFPIDMGAILNTTGTRF